MQHAVLKIKYFLQLYEMRWKEVCAPLCKENDDWFLFKAALQKVSKKINVLTVDKLRQVLSEGFRCQMTEGNSQIYDCLKKSSTL